MALVQSLKRYFDAKVAKRGERYFREGAVESFRGDARKVIATVIGSDVYQVQAEYQPGAHTLTVDCDCPYVDEFGGACKHIYAVLREADGRRKLGDAAGDSRLRLALKYEAEYGDEGEEEDEPGDVPDESDSPTSARVADALARLMKSAPPGLQVVPLSGLLPKQASPKNTWRQQFQRVEKQIAQASGVGDESWPANRRLLYVLDRLASIEQSAVILHVMSVDEKSNGATKPSLRRVSYDMIPRLPDESDRRILSLLNGSNADEHWGSHGDGYGWGGSKASDTYRLTPEMQKWLLPIVCESGRGFGKFKYNAPLTPLRWDAGVTWELVLKFALAKNEKNRLSGHLTDGPRTIQLSEASMLTEGGLCIYDGVVSPFDHRGAFAWVPLLGDQGHVDIPSSHAREALAALLEMPTVPRLELPESMRFEQVHASPRPMLQVRAAKPPEYTDRLVGQLSFEYEGRVVPSAQAGKGFLEAGTHRYIVRDLPAERVADATVRGLGFRDPAKYYRDNFPPGALVVAPKKLPAIVRELTTRGWRIEAEGKLYRQAGKFEMNVSSGVDWFELHGAFDFGGQLVGLPKLLAALKRGENYVLLDDGSFGILPEQWLEKYGALTSLAEAREDHLRFKPAQVGLLDALLASMPEARCDEVFARARDRLRHFEGIKPLDPPESFTGQLRPYQAEGLGWFQFLREFRFGGCLADDMGLGKTIQVLALLEARRKAPGDRTQRTSLVVAPRSLVFNWKQEAVRFTPGLKLLDHTGLQRTKATEHFEDYDLVLTTYGTLRRDAAHFKDARFDYAILDEAQAIKNASTESAKAVRLIQADHRLALSGTPVENHLGELWSLLEFLNPGMLGSRSAFNAGPAMAQSHEGRALLASALRPFILRRTKKQVAADLPEKTEQTLYCDLPPAQRRQYDELREYYRNSILKSVGEKGMGRTKIQVLEALLRLRQAACHPGLIDKTRSGEASAKLEALFPQLEEVLSEGHKALVFSQFTSFLAIVRKQLDQQKIKYEYLDGKTTDRRARVERFQADPSCGLFLISLKAGGLGLNLTAADYVFLLDPWWNPAVESQAVDRAHRIGQTRSVMAYRLIARDTVEEKVLQLQSSKRELADAIISQNNSLIRDLKREDLELLLS